MLLNAGEESLHLLVGHALGGCRQEDLCVHTQP
jgi:hypothetical protein